MSDTDIKEANRQKAQAALEHLDALDKDPHFAWFVAKVLEGKRDEERNSALDMLKSSAERERACWRHDFAKALCEETARLRRMYDAQAKASP